jgi:hypothetical protein
MRTRWGCSKFEFSLACRSVVAALGKTIVPSTWATEWPELIQFMQSCSTAANPVHRELGLILLREQAEFVGSKLDALGESVRPMIFSALSAPETAVQIAGLRALGTFLSVVSDDDRAITRYAGLLEPLVRVTEQLLGRSDEAVIASLDVLAGKIMLLPLQRSAKTCSPTPARGL